MTSECFQKNDVQSRVKDVRLQEKIGKQNFNYDSFIFFSSYQKLSVIQQKKLKRSQ